MIWYMFPGLWLGKMVQCSSLAVRKLVSYLQNREDYFMNFQARDRKHRTIPYFSIIFPYIMKLESFIFFIYVCLVISRLVKMESLLKFMLLWLLRPYLILSICFALGVMWLQTIKGFEKESNESQVVIHLWKWLSTAKAEIHFDARHCTGVNKKLLVSARHGWMKNNHTIIKKKYGRTRWEYITSKFSN